MLHGLLCIDRSARRRATILALAALAFSGEVRAQSPAAEKGAPSGSPAADVERTARSREHIRLGTVAFEKKNFALAIQELRAAYEAAPDPSILYALGQAYRMNGDCARAREAYQRFLESKPAEKHREAAIANLERCASPSAPAEPPPAGAAAAPAPSADSASTAAAASAPANETMAPPPGPPRAERRPFYLDVPGGVLTGAGLVSAVAGTVIFAGGRSRVASADGVRDDGAFGETRDDADSGLREQRIGLVFVGLGAALATAGVIRYVSVGRRSNHASLQMTPGPFGLFARGTF